MAQWLQQQAPQRGFTEPVTIRDTGEDQHGVAMVLVFPRVTCGVAISREIGVATHTFAHILSRPRRAALYRTPSLSPHIVLAPSGASSEVRMVLSALSLGGAGCLSTVSTFVNETRQLPLVTGLRYVAVSLIIGQIASVSIWCAFIYGVDA